MLSRETVYVSELVMAIGSNSPLSLPGRQHRATNMLGSVPVAQVSLVTIGEGQRRPTSTIVETAHGRKTYYEFPKDAP